MVFRHRACVVSGVADPELGPVRLQRKAPVSERTRGFFFVRGSVTQATCLAAKGYRMRTEKASAKNSGRTE